jgi:polysaccharide deacetylase family protein (PEP-CTERM system associated)
MSEPVWVQDIQHPNFDDSNIASTVNVLSFDLEHWHSATLLHKEINDPVDRIYESVELVLDLLEKRAVTATFFTVGRVAREYPDLIRRVNAAGHEIASHGHTHTPVFDLTPEQFETELQRSIEAISDAVGTRPKGFRAPNFSITPRTEWAMNVIESNGFSYDSSVFPVRTPMYGTSRAPIRPYVPDSQDPFIPARGKSNGTSIEFPLAVYPSRIRLPVAGGFYLRLMPVRMLKYAVRYLNERGIPATIYFHPWEFNPAVPVDSVTPHKRFVSFHGIDGLSKKLDSLLDSFEFTSFEHAIA